MKKKLTIRFGVFQDKKYWIEWLSEPGILQWFPMSDRAEIEDSANILMTYIPYNAVLTALWDEVPCGIANLYLQPYKKLSHQCLFGIIVEKACRGKGIGTILLQDLMKLAKERFHIEILHLEVYDDNPAVNLYKRLGFQQYGYHPRFTKEDGKYRGKICMQKIL